LPRITTITDDGRSFLEESEIFGHANDRNLDVYLSAKKRSPQQWRDEVDDCRIILRGTLPDVEGDPSSTPGYSDAWRGLWRLINFMQDIPGFHIEYEGVDTLSAPDLTTTGVGHEDGAWLEVLSLVDDVFRPLVEVLQAAETTVPDMLGADITKNGEVVGMIEFGWSDLRLAICEDAFDVSDLELIPFDPEGSQSVTEVAAFVLRRIEEISV